MSEFVRVRSVEGPDTEYDAPLSLVEANPDRYIRVGEPEQRDELAQDEAQEPAK